MGIIETGAILPNNGRFPVTYLRSNHSYGRRIGAVSLFDFASASLTQIEEFEAQWGAFLYDQRPSIFIEIERRLIVDQLTPNQAAWDECRNQCMWIPCVEAWCRGEIPIAAFKRYIVPGKDLPKGYEILRHHPRILDQICGLAIKAADVPSEFELVAQLAASRLESGC
jgi:hypothetical protein